MIKHISKFSFQEINRVKLTPGQTTRAHYKNRIENPDKFNTFFLLEPGTDHVYDMFFDWAKFKELAENMYFRLDYDWCYTADYIEAFGKNPVPQRPYYGFNTVVHGYSKPGGWYLETIDHAHIGWTFVDAWAKGNNYWTKRYSSKGIYWSTYKWDRLYTKIIDWTPGFDALVEKWKLEVCK